MKQFILIIKMDHNVKKNNIIIYDESIYDDSCRINYD